MTVSFGGEAKDLSKPEAPKLAPVAKATPVENMEALRNQPFEELTTISEFQLSKNPDPNGSKPIFEVVRLDDFDFDFGSTEIRPRYHERLNQLVKYLNAPPAVMRMRVEGHTDSVGSADRNRMRSLGRADAIKNYLVKHGLNPAIQVETVGYGADKPISDNSNYQGRQQNRRVEIRTLRNHNQTMVLPDK